jgi:hypothetical protein
LDALRNYYGCYHPSHRLLPIIINVLVGISSPVSGGLEPR